MLSAGRPGLDNIYSLCEGILRLEVDKATYQRLGLNGTVVASGGRKHVKTRYGEQIMHVSSSRGQLTISPAIELNLRLPSMVYGKHGFKRILWAFKNVLNQSVTWLFYNLNGNNDGSGPISQHQPMIKRVEPHVDSLNGICVPEPSQAIREDDHDLVNGLLEWLSLAAMASPRIQSLDKIDIHLSRYQIPASVDGDGKPIKCSTQDLTRFHWQGFLPATFIKHVALAALKASGTEWFGLNVIDFDGQAYSILQRKHHILTWEYAD
jgi:ribonucleases P/MRP protein subunit RPP40